MLSWTQIFSGAGLSALAAVAVTILAVRERRASAILLAAVAAITGPVAWNAVLHSAGSDDFFHDAPIALFPMSWQDVGSGVWTLAFASVVFGFTQSSSRRATVLALATAVAAFLVDIYLY